MDAAAAAGLTSAPAERVAPRRLLGIGGVWLASGFTAAISYSLLPASATLVAGRSADLLVGQVTAIGNVVVIAMPVLAGWLSDRTVSPWGRRAPWLAALAAVASIGLVLLGLASLPVVLIAAYLVYQVGASGQGGIFNAILPDLVPARHRGVASGVLATMAGLGGIAGLSAISAILLLAGEGRAGVLAGYCAIAVVILALTTVTLLSLRERASSAENRPPSAQGTLRVHVAHLMTALRDRDFAWSAANRALFNFGYYTVQPFLAFYFRDVGRSAHPAASAALWGVLVVVSAVGPALVGGRLSDRIGRRKPFLLASGLAQAAVVVVMVGGLPFSYAMAYGEALLFGVGYGLYYAVDLALACDVLPDTRAAGRDMGIWHAAYSVPPVLAPAIAAPVLHLLNQSGTVFGITTGPGLGYRVVFLGSAVWFLLGTLTVTRLRRVR